MLDNLYVALNVVWGVSILYLYRNELAALRYMTKNIVASTYYRTDSNKNDRFLYGCFAFGFCVSASADAYTCFNEYLIKYFTTTIFHVLTN